MAASSSGTPANGPPSARFLLSGATNNPHQSWLGYFGIPEDIAEWTIDDVRSTVASIAPSVLSAAPAAAGANASAVPPPPASLRRTVTLADFDRYLRTIGEPYRFFAASRPAVVGADSGEAGGGGLRVVPDRAVPDKGGEAPGGGHLASAATADRLKAVPPIVFSDSFELTEPETFRVFSPDGAPAASMVMIEKLANYLDQVELTLLSEVSSRAAGFFEALASYDRLWGEVEAGVRLIASMRSRLRTLELNLVHQPLHLPRLARRKANVSSLHDKLRLIQAVVQSQPTIAQLLSAADFPGALELIGSAQQLLQTELKGVAALVPMGESLVAMKALIEATMARDLLEIALGYDPDSPPPPFPVEVVASTLSSRIAPLATGLLHLDALNPPLRRLSAALKIEVKATPKRVLQAELPKHGAEDAGGDVAPSEAPGEKAKGLVAQLKDLDVDAYEDVMGKVGAALMVLLRRAAAVHDALAHALAAAAPPVHTDETTPQSDEPHPPGADGRSDEPSRSDLASSRAYVSSLSEETAGLILAVAELAADRFGRYVRARAECHTRLSLAGFAGACRVAEEFGADVAHVVGVPCHTITAEVASQANAFIERIHVDASKKLEMVIEQEQWTQVSVPVEFQSIVDSICSNQVPRATAPDLLALNGPDAPPAESPATEIVLEGAGYKVVGSGLILLSIVANYLQCAAAVAATTPRVAHVLPALLKMYHTRAYKQVLMAGAMLPTSAGLKSISFKHLALSSQSLGVVLALIPHLKAILTAYLPEAHRPLLHEFDSASADFAAHQQQIFAKFVSILEERRRGRMKEVAAALTPAPGSARQPEPSANIKSVATDLRAVHKTLRDLLTRQQLHELFGQILTAYDAGLLETYRGLDTTAAYTRQCIVQDVQHLRKEVAKLHLSLPAGCCPELVAHALALPVA